MKNLQHVLKKRWKLIGEQDASLKHRKTSFQIAVTALLTAAILCITWYLIKILP